MKEEHAFLHSPIQNGSLRHFVREEYKDCRFVIFSDSAVAVDHLDEFMRAASSRIFVGTLRGDVDATSRDEIVNAFRMVKRSLLLTTSVCDAAIDFPQGCIIIQLHTSSGSRQTEVQRCGRGSRGDVTTTKVIHMVNDFTEEDAFVKRRLEHMRENYGSSVSIKEDDFDFGSNTLQDVDFLPHQSMVSSEDGSTNCETVEIANAKGNKRGWAHRFRQIQKRQRISAKC